MTQYTEAEADAIGAANDLARSFEKRGWITTSPVLAAGYAGVRISKEGHEDVQGFFAVDPDAHQDRYLYGAFTVSEDMLPAIAESVSRTEVALLVNMDAHVKPKRKRANAAHPMPPTSAAHTDDSHAVPPTDAAHPWDNPNHDVMADLADAAHTSAENAAHPVFTASQAEIDAIVPPTEPELEYSVQRDGAAHMRPDELVTRPMPPIPDVDAAHMEGFEEYGEIASAAHIADVAKGHIKQAGETYSQQETYAAVQDYINSRMWSSVASELSDAALLKKTRGKRIVWRNSLSGKRDEAVVSKDAERHAAKITGELTDREDLRILHFLEAGGGFRSVAVARIVRLG